MSFEQWAPYWRARFFMMFNRHERALEGFQAALAANPGFGRAAAHLGYAYAMLGRDELAVRYFEQAARDDPRNVAALFDLGFVLDRSGDKEGAIAAFERAVALKPTLDRAWYGMGLAHAVLGRHDKAAEALGRAAELQPMNPYAWYNLGMAHSALGERKKVEEARRHLDRFDPKMARKLATDAGLPRGGVMLLLAIILKGLAELVLLVMLGQGILFVLAGAQRHDNLVYRAFATVTAPIMKATRFVTPKLVVDQHIWMVALFLVVATWVLALALKVHYVLEASGAAR